MSSREAARRMIAAAPRAEADAYVERFSDEVDEDGRQLVVGNGRARERKGTIGSGTIPVRAPRVNDKRVNEDTLARVSESVAMGLVAPARPNNDQRLLPRGALALVISVVAK